MAETFIEKYRRLIAEAKAIEPKPAEPIEGLSLDPGEKGGMTITTNGEGKELSWHEIKLDSKKETVYPTVTLTDVQMDALCVYWSEAKKEAKALG